MTTFIITITDINLDSARKRALAAAKEATGPDVCVQRSSVDISPGQRTQDGRILTFEYDFTLELAVPGPTRPGA